MFIYLLFNTISNLIFLFAGFYICNSFRTENAVKTDKPKISLFAKEPKEIKEKYIDEEAFVPDDLSNQNYRYVRD
jgi:hypothetical protein